jgi:hypothetical protein
LIIAVILLEFSCAEETNPFQSKKRKVAGMRAIHLLILVLLVFSVAGVAGCLSDDSDDGTTDGDVMDGDEEPVDGDAAFVDGDEQPADGDAESVDGDEEFIDGDDEPLDGDVESSGGTWRDLSSELVWQNPPLGGEMTWQEAVDYCQTLSITERVAWRLPTIDELRSLVRGCAGTVTDGACGVTGACTDNYCIESGGCSACTYQDGPADGCYRPDEIEGACTQVWSSTPVGDLDNYVWSVDFTYGSVYYYSADYGNFVWCVR